MPLPSSPALLLHWKKAWDGNGFVPLSLVLSEGRFHLPSDYPGCLREISYDDDTFAIPAIIDFHVHIHERIAGCDLADDFASYARLAQVSGIQAIGAFITEAPSPDGRSKLAAQYEEYNAAASRRFNGFVRWHLTPVQSGVADVLPLLGKGCDLKFYTTYKAAGIYRDYEDIAHWMQDLQDIKPPMLVHCEDDALISAATERYPFTHPRAHALRRPPEAEIRAVDRLCDLSARYDYPVHIVHVSTPQAAKLIQDAKDHAPITCETSPNYLFLNDSLYDQPEAHRYLCTPPLRSETMRGELRELAQDGIFDIYATDHCPFTKTDKDRYHDNLSCVPNGIAGSGALLPLLIDKLGVPPAQVISRLCDNPARLMRMGDEYCALQPGNPARFIMLRSATEQDAAPAYLPSLADTYNPWTGQVSATIVVSPLRG